MKFRYSFVNQIKDVLVSPVLFFETKQKEQGIRKSFYYLIGLTIVNTLVSIIVLSVPWVSRGGRTYDILGVFPAALISFATGIVLSFVIVGGLHLWIKLFGGKGSYAKTYQMYSYSRTPAMLLEFFPIINVVATIYSIVLMALATERFHKLSRKRTVIAFIVLFVLITGLQYLLLLLYVRFFGYTLNTSA